MGAFSPSAEGQSNLGYVQPDAGMVFGVEWRKIVTSSIGSLVTEQIKSGIPTVPGVQMLQNAILNDVDSLLISSSSSAMSKSSSQPAILVVVKGRFNVDQLRGMIPGKPAMENYRGVDLLTVSDDVPAAGAKPAQQNRIAFLDANTILGGDRTEMRAAIDRIKTGTLTGSDRGILTGVGALAASNDLWLVVEVPASALKDAPPAAAQMFQGVKSTELGMSFGQGFGMQVNVRTKDAESAQTMQQTFQGLLALAAMSQSDNPQAADMIRKVRVTSENTQVKMAVALDRAELEKILKEAQASTKATAGRTAPAPAPSGSKTIRISGAEGTVELTPEKK